MSKLFLGSYQYTLDPKKRVRVPVNFKELLGKEVVLTLVDNNEISLSSKEWFENYLQSMYLAETESKIKQAKLIRHLSAMSIETSVDASGRILLPDSYVEYAKIDKEVVFMGNGQKVLILSKDSYDNYLKNANEENIFEEAIDTFKDKLFM